MKRKAFILMSILFIFISIGLLAETTIEQKQQDLEEKLKSASGKEKIEILTQLAYQYRSISPKKSIDYGNQALELAQKLKDVQREATALVNIGVGNSHTGNQQESLIYLKKALKIFKHLGDKKGIADSLNKIGGVYIRSSHFDQALDYLQKSLKIREEIGDKKGAGDSLGNMGVVYKELGDIVQALSYQLQSLEIREEIGDKFGTAASSNNIGVLYAILNQNENSLKYFLKSLKLKEEIGDQLGAASSLNNIGVIYNRLSNYEKALEYHQKSMEIREERGDKNGAARTSNNIGIIYSKLGHYHLALKYYQKSLKIYEETGNKRGISITLNGIGNVYRLLHHFNKALSYFNRSLKIAREIKTKNTIEANYENLSQLYTAKGDYKKALEYHQLFFEVNQEIFNEEKNRQITEMETRYKTLKQEKRIELLEKNNQIQKIQLSKERVTRNAFIFGFILVIIILVLLFRKYLYLFASWKKQKYIGQFRLMEKIGSGGMGVIYKAHHIKNKSEIYAIKVLREELSENRDIIRRFKQEATIIDKLDHPHIVKIIERGQYKQRFFIAMELLEGKTLETKLAEDGPIHLNVCLHIMKQITAALSLIHSNNVIHRDMKPSNIMLVNKNGDHHFVKLLDFGVARMKFQTKLTRTGILLGTTNYLSPEQINNSGISTASDLFSLGIIFYEMVCGKKPFAGECESDIIKEILEKQPMEPRRLRVEVPVQLNTLIMRMLEKPQESRPSCRNVLAIINTITPCCNEKSNSGTPPK